MTDTQIIIALLIAFAALWIVLFVIVRRHYRKTTKKVQDAHKDNTVTFLDDNDLSGRYVDIQFSEYPWCEMHRRSN